MKFELPPESIGDARNEERLREFLSGNKTAFAQAFWENTPLAIVQDGCAASKASTESER